MEDLRALLNRVVKGLDADVKKLEAKVDKLMRLPDMAEIENLMKTMVWAMDSGDKDLWLSIWSDDVHYVVQQYNIDIKGKRALAEFGERAIFTNEKKRFSTLMNIMIDVTGNTATGKDYYSHYGYPINRETGKMSEEPAFSDGMHYYKFRKDEGVWMITKLEVYVHRRQEAGAQR
jgi:ketosteroid isomerase-like protein